MEDGGRMRVHKKINVDKLSNKHFMGYYVSRARLLLKRFIYVED